MSFSDLRPAARRLLLLTWAAGALSLFAITIRSLVNDTPYPAPWAWLSFLGMMVIEDLVCIEALSVNGVKLGDRVTIGRFTSIKCTGVLGNMGVGLTMGDGSCLVVSGD